MDTRFVAVPLHTCRIFRGMKIQNSSQRTPFASVWIGGAVANAHPNAKQSFPVRCFALIRPRPVWRELSWACADILHVMLGLAIGIDRPRFLVLRPRPIAALLIAMLVDEREVVGRARSTAQAHRNLVIQSGGHLLHVAGERISHWQINVDWLFAKRA
jgi:hypothetical protein